MTPRVVFACWPFEGHIFPQMSMAIALRERGAEVAFYTDESQRELIEDQGFELLPFRRVTRTWERVHGRDRGTGGARHMLQLMREARAWMVDSIPDQVADLHDIVATWDPDVIGAEASMWGPLLVLSELGPVPVGLVSPLIGAPMPEADDSPTGRIAAQTRRLVTTPLRRRLDAIRARHGLGPMGCSVSEYFGRLPLCLVLSVPELDAMREDLPAPVSYVGACQWHPPDSPGTTEWLSRLPSDRPWVHVTEGTSRFAERSLLQAAAEGFADAPLEVLITTGRGSGTQAADAPPRAPNIHVTEWLSHDVLLPRCAAIVTTGGMGTVIAALRSGVPLVVVPTGWDKPANARRVVAAGVGVQLSPRRCTAETLRGAVDEVLANPRYRQGALRAAELLAGAPGPAGAAELIAGLAGGARAAATPAAGAGKTQS